MEGATRVFGNSKAAWFRDGHYFNGAGVEITPEEAAQPDYIDEPVPVVSNEPPSYERSVQPTGIAVSLADTEAKIVGTASPVADLELAAEPEPRTRVDVLGALHTPALAKLVKVAGGEPATGKGARAANIRWLIDNTAD